MKEPEEDILFTELMSKSRLEMPFPDFEDTVMAQIKKQELYKEVYSGNIKLSWICFLAGTVFGIILSVLLPQLQISLFGIGPDTIKFVFQLFFSLFILFGLDLLIRYTRKISISELIVRD